VRSSCVRRHACRPSSERLALDFHLTARASSISRAVAASVLSRGTWPSVNSPHRRATCRDGPRRGSVARAGRLAELHLARGVRLLRVRRSPPHGPTSGSITTSNGTARRPLRSGRMARACLQVRGRAAPIRESVPGPSTIVGRAGGDDLRCARIRRRLHCDCRRHPGRAQTALARAAHVRATTRLRASPSVPHAQGGGGLVVVPPPHYASPRRPAVSSTVASPGTRSASGLERCRLPITRADGFAAHHVVQPLGCRREAAGLDRYGRPG